ncbi:MAG: hypothetical protein AAF938_27485 [Myxococcota bacterium]
MRAALALRAAPVLLGLLGSSCGGGGGGSTSVVVRPVITRIDASQPSVVGTTLRVQVANLDALTAGATLNLADGLSLPIEPIDGDGSRGGVAEFVLTSQVIDVFGPGVQLLDLTIGDEFLISDPFTYNLDLAEELEIALEADIDESGLFRNSTVVVDGAGFLEEGEGEVLAVLTGVFDGPDGRVTIAGEVPVVQAEPGDRRRGAVVVTTALGGIGEGEFEGTVLLESRLTGGGMSRSRERNVRIQINPPTFFGLGTEETFLESLVDVRGGGFLGAERASETDEQTVVLIEGSFTDGDGDSRSFSESLVLPWRSGSSLLWRIAAEPNRSEDALISTLFGTDRGVLDATFTPLVSKEGFGEVRGIGGPAILRLGAITQVVWVRFLPTFYQTLPLFGLAASAGTIEELIRERMQAIYEGWNVDVRLEEPLDVSRNGVTIVEISGPDPNGRGLFGYDNTPGKDIGNLRMGDLIGGLNAETQANGFAGFGGVFIDGYLYFSETRTPGDGMGPEPDPLFDEIFDAVIDAPASLADVQGTTARRAEVELAMRALANMIGETTAHELGHSLGLPFQGAGERVRFHNRGDTPGCLMDSGGAREFGERVGAPGFAESRFCGENDDYLDVILGE